MSKGKHPGGRPTKYEPKYHIPWAKGLLRRGATIKELAEEFDVNVSTVYEWSYKHPEFSEVLKEDRQLADFAVEESLYRRAMGTKVTEKRTIVTAGADGESHPSRIEIVEKELPPDSTACIFWLKNRNPKLWRDKQDIQVNEIDDKNIKEFIEALGLGEEDAEAKS